MGQRWQLRRRRAPGGGAGEAYLAIPPNKVGLAKSRIMGRLEEREAYEKDDGIVGDLEYQERKGGVLQGKEGTRLYIKSRNLK